MYSKLQHVAYLEMFGFMPVANIVNNLKYRVLSLIPLM